MRAAIASLVLVFLPILACAQPDIEDDTTPASPSATVKASEETRSALGVTSWSVERKSARTVSIVGNDDAGRAIVRVDQRYDGGRSLEATVQRDGHTASAAVDLQAHAATKNDLAHDASARAVLARIADDLEHQPIARSGATSLRTASRLGARALVEDAGGPLVDQNGVCLTRVCNSALVDSSAAGAWLTLTCTEERAEAGECIRRIDDSRRKEKRTKKSCEDGSDTQPPPAGEPGSCDPELATGAVPKMERALLDTIAYTEGTAASCENDGYDTGFGYNCFASCASHPHIVWSGSSASGRYQFLDFTWDGLGKSDFGPRNQDIAAMELVRRRGVTIPQDRPLDEEEFEAAMHKLSYEWASLPFSPYGQPTKSLEDTRAHYCAFAGCECK